MNTFSIACAAEGCLNPVIGQCSGYKGSCGKYYCRQHSSGSLCADCSYRKLADERAQQVYQDYLNTAEGIEREVRSAFRSRHIIKWVIKWVLAVMLMGAACLLLALLIQVIFSPQNGEATQAFAIFFTFIGGSSIMLSIYYGPILWIIKRSRWIREQGKTKAIEINNSRPGFFEFFTTWKKDKNRQKLMNTLAIAGGIAAGIVAVAGNSSEDSRIRRAVDSELKSHGL